MRRHLLQALICPRCGAHPMHAAGAQDVVDEGWVECPHGHRLEVRQGVLHAMGELTPEIAGQLEENARERRGELSDDEKNAYRRNISRIGLATYNRLIRDNGRAALDAISVHGGRSLDLGGGSGWLAAELAGRDFEAVSLDIEEPHERLAQIEGGAAGRDFELVTDVLDEPARDAVDYVVGDMEQLPFADGAFDLVTTSAALHHSADPVRTLRQAARVLRPGGVLLALNEPAKGLFRDESPILGAGGRPPASIFTGPAPMWVSSVRPASNRDCTFRVGSIAFSAKETGRASSTTAGCFRWPGGCGRCPSCEPWRAGRFCGRPSISSASR